MKTSYWLVKMLVYAPAMLICGVLAIIGVLLVALFWPRRLRSALSTENIEEWQWAKNNRRQGSSLDPDANQPKEVPS